MRRTSQPGTTNGPVASDVPAPRLEDQTCFSLYAASRAITALYRPLLDELDLTYPQYLVMLVLWECNDRGVGEIGAALSLDSGTLSPLLKRLERRGLISRNRRDDDERSVSITVTDEGDALRGHCLQLPRQISEATGMSADDLAQLSRTLRRLTDSVNDYRMQLAADA